MNDGTSKPRVDVAYEDLGEFFVVDGSWRDIYVHRATLQEWLAMLALVRERYRRTDSRRCVGVASLRWERLQMK